MELDIADIQREYPNPRSANDNLPGTGYCVGGAFCQYADEHGVGIAPFRFPVEDDLAKALQQANPNLTFDLAYSFANEITSYNDAGQFHEAWEFLDEALSYEGDNDGSF